MLYPQKKRHLLFMRKVPISFPIKLYMLNRKVVSLDTTTIIPNITLLPVGWSKNRPNDNAADE